MYFIWHRALCYLIVNLFQWYEPAKCVNENQKNKNSHWKWQRNEFDIHKNWKKEEKKRKADRINSNNGNITDTASNNKNWKIRQKKRELIIMTEFERATLLSDAYDFRSLVAAFIQSERGRFLFYWQIHMLNFVPLSRSIVSYSIWFMTSKNRFGSISVVWRSSGVKE